MTSTHICICFEVDSHRFCPWLKYILFHRDVVVIPASRCRHVLTQAPADDGASHVVCSAPGVGGDVVHSSDLGRANGTPLVFFVERGSPPEVSSEGSRSRDNRWRAGTPPYVDNWPSVRFRTSAMKVRVPLVQPQTHTTEYQQNSCTCSRVVFCWPCVGSR